MKKIWVRVPLLSAGWLALLAGLGAVLLHFAGLSSWIGAYLTATTPYLIVAAVAAPILFALARSWIAVATGAVVLAVGLWTQAPLYTSSAAPSGPAVVAMTANMRIGAADPAAIVRAARAASADVLSIQELTPQAVPSLGAAGLDQLFPHRYIAPGTGATGTGIWSRHPLRDTREYPGFVLNQLSATVQHPTVGPVTFFAVHPGAPIAETGAAIWHSELQRLRDILDHRPPGRTIVAGDFNSTHDHSGFRALLNSGLADVAAETGRGYLVTWPTDKGVLPPVIGIDHILVADGNAKDIKAVGIPDTDHKAVIATVTFAPVT